MEKVSESMKEWFKKAKNTVELDKKYKLEKNKDEIEISNNIGDTEDDTDNGISNQQIRMRVIGDLNTVVSGTGKLVQMLKQNWNGETEMDEEAMQGGENYLTNFVVETPHLHADDDLDEVIILVIIRNIIIF